MPITNDSEDEDNLMDQWMAKISWTQLVIHSMNVSGGLHIP